MHEVKLPKVGTSATEAEVVEILVQVGQRVAVGDDLIEVETDKSTFSIDAEVAGEVVEILVEVDQEYSIGTVLCRIKPDGE